MIPIRTPWTRQPQVAAQYRPGWSAQPLPGLVRGVSTHGLSVVTVGTVATTPTQQGIASAHASGTNMRRAVIPSSVLGSTGGASLLAVFRTKTAETDRRIVSLGADNGSSGNTIFAIGTGVSAASSIRATIGGGVTNIGVDYAGVALNNGEIHAVVITSTLFSAGTATEYAVHMDGSTLQARIAGSVIGSNTLYNWIVASGFRRGGVDTAGPQCDVLLAVPFFGALSDVEARALSANPWQLFAPIERRIWVPSAGGGPTHTIAADAATYTLTGAAAGLTVSRKIVAGSGAYAITGANTNLKVSRKLSAAAGSYALTGGNVTLKAARKLVAGSGSYALTGAAVTFNYSGSGATYTLTADSGSYTLTTASANLLVSRKLVAGAGSFAVTYQDASLRRLYTLVAGSGSYSLNSTAAALKVSRKIVAGVGAYTLTGSGVTLNYSGATSVTIPTMPPYITVYMWQRTA